MLFYLEMLAFQHKASRFIRQGMRRLYRVLKFFGLEAKCVISTCNPLPRSSHVALSICKGAGKFEGEDRSIW